MLPVCWYYPRSRSPTAFGQPSTVPPAERATGNSWRNSSPLPPLQFRSRSETTVGALIRGFPFWLSDRYRFIHPVISFLTFLFTERLLRLREGANPACEGRE